MVEYCFKCGSGLKTSENLDIILSSKLFKLKKIPVKKIQKWLTYLPVKNILKVWNMGYGVMMCFDAGVVD